MRYHVTFLILFFILFLTSQTYCEEIICHYMEQSGREAFPDQTSIVAQAKNKIKDALALIQNDDIILCSYSAGLSLEQNVDRFKNMLETGVYTPVFLYKGVLNKFYNIPKTYWEPTKDFAGINQDEFMFARPAPKKSKLIYFGFRGSSNNNSFFWKFNRASKKLERVNNDEILHEVGSYLKKRQ